MVKKFLIIFILANIYAFLFAENTENILANVYLNFNKINTLDILLEIKQININKKSNGKVEKKNEARILYKKPGKRKIIYINSLNKNIEQTIKNENSDKEKIELHPYCLFNIEDFLKNFEIKIKHKDVRIKRGMEEIIAIRKGQATNYPQVRIFVQGNRILEMKFYTATGKKYYELKVIDYKKIEDIEFPIKINEKFIADNNYIINTINYKKIKINKEISDKEFSKG